MSKACELVQADDLRCAAYAYNHMTAFLQNMSSMLPLHWWTI